MKKGIMLRKCANFKGLNEHFYRCAVKNHKDNIKLIEAIKKEVSYG
ncbi:MAG: hypothetical protein RR011_04635 [Oscillospiraceae bacterium]